MQRLNRRRSRRAARTGISKKITDYKKLSEELEVGEETLKDIVKELEKTGEGSA